MINNGVQATNPGDGDDVQEENSMMSFQELWKCANDFDLREEVVSR